MKPESFFGKFDQFADAPDAIEKMRELVLQLAVKGKLVPQDKRDEPACLLVASAKAERAKLVAARKIKARPAEPVNKHDQPYELPSSWTWTRLSDVGYELGQKVPDKRFTYIDVGGIDPDKGRISDRVEELEPGDAPSRARKLVARGTVIYSTVRPYLLNIAIVEQDYSPEPIASTAFGVLHPFKGINNRYLFYWLRSAPFTTYVQKGMKGMAYPAISDAKFYSGFIALPPLAEQKRIVAQVDALMALCDRLALLQQERETRHTALARASLTRFSEAPTPANLSFLFHPSYTISPADLRKSILSLAARGKLVPQNPDDEPTAVLLDRIDATRHELLITGTVPKQKPLGAIDEHDCQHPVPETWHWVRLQRVAEIIDPNPSHRMPRYCASGVPFISTENFVGREEIDFTIGKQVDKAELEDQKGRFSIRPGSFALSRIGTIGKTRTLPLVRNYAMSHALVVIAPYSEDVDPRFLRMVVSSDAVQSQASHGAKSIGVPDLGMGKIRSFVIPFPPLAEQRRIVTKVHQLMALMDSLEARLDHSRTAGARLLDAVVAELTAARHTSDDHH